MPPAFSWPLLVPYDTVVVAEVGNGLEVGRQATCEPHAFDVALGFTLQATAGLDPVQLTVDVELEQDCRVVGRTTCTGRISAFETEWQEVQLVNERIDDAHRVVLADIVVEAFRQQAHLLARLAFDESLHGAPSLEMRCPILFLKLQGVKCFHTASTDCEHSRTLVSCQTSSIEWALRLERSDTPPPPAP